MSEYEIAGGIPLSWLLAVSVAVLGGVFGLLKWFAGRMIDEIEQRLQRIDELESRFERLMAELPLHYQRREDSIREYTALNAKIDRIYELMVRAMKENL